MSCKWLSYDLSTLHFIVGFSIIFRALRLIAVFDYKYRLDYNKYRLKESFYLKVKIKNNFSF